MKRYLLFQGFVYFPRGGWRDLSGSYASDAEAVLSVSGHLDPQQWWEVVDVSTGLAVKWSPNRAPING